MANKNEKLVAVLSYFLVGIIWYFADDSVQGSLSKLHVKQSINLAVISIVGSIILGFIPIIGWLLLPFFNLAVLVLWVIGLITAINGKKKEIPLIGKYAEKYLNF